MSFRLDPAIIEAKLHERGWKLTDLAEAAAISTPTAWRAASGKPVSPVTANKVMIAFARFNPNPQMVELLGRRDQAS